MSVTMVITDEMIYEFNTILANEESVIRLERRQTSIDISLLDKQYIGNFTLNPTKEFYEKLEKFFASKGITNLSYNNTGSCFWKFE